MEHIGLILTILAFGTGMVSTTNAIMLYKKYPIPYLKYHYMLYIFFNIVVFFGLLFNYMQFNLMNNLSENTVWIFINIYHFEVSLGLIIILYFFVKMVFFLLEKERSRKRKNLLFYSFGILILAQGICSVFDLHIGERALYFLFLIIIMIFFHLISYLIIINLYFKYRSQGSSLRERKLKKFSIFLFFVFTAFLLLNIFQGANIISLALYLTLLPIIVSIINLVPLASLKRFVKQIFPQKTSPVNLNKFMNRLMEKYKISKREQQIIQLICNGKSNKEIESELFISHHTVKEYIYRIYKKTGVKNRVQLTNLFRDQ